MRLQFHWLFSAFPLFLILGCATPEKITTASGKPEIQLQNITRKQVVDLIVSVARAQGTQIKNVTDYGVVIRRKYDGVLGNALPGSTEGRVIYNVADIGSGVTVFGRYEMVFNPENINERIEDHTDSVATQVQSDLERLKVAWGAKLAASPKPTASAEPEATKQKESKFHAPKMITIPGKDFEMGRFDVTRGQFAEFVNETNYDAGGKCWTFEGEWEERSGRNWRNPGFPQDDNHPVACVNWNDAQAYILWLSKKTGKQYRLPREAEWEYACYGGSQTEYCGSNDINAVAWYESNSGGQTHAVGQKQANGYGLYDMSGNVWQWMEDCGEGDCAQRMLRGGSWNYEPQIVRAAYRFRLETTIRTFNYGFRLARTLP